MESVNNQKTNGAENNVFQQPIWDSKSKHEITGEMLEILIRANEVNSQVGMVLQHVINTGLLNGTIKMKYSKLNPQGTGYEPMSPEESKPYEDNLQALIGQAKEIAQKAKSAPQDGEVGNAPRLDAIVNQHGEPFEDLAHKKLKVVE